jgi:tetratricopeptide (TPR) repeat protein
MTWSSALVEIVKAVMSVTLVCRLHIPGQNLKFARPSTCKETISHAVCLNTLRLNGGIDYSRWDGLDDEGEQKDEKLQPPTFEDNMNLMRHHSRKDQVENEEEEGLDEAEDDADADWQCNLGDMECGAGFLDRAERAFQRALQINQTHVQSLVSYGNLLIEKQEYARAEGMFATALKLDPTNIEATESLQALEEEDVAEGA